MKIIITVDVEDPYNPKEMNRIWGKAPDDYYGIPKIVEILKSYNMRATFFVDVYEKGIHGEKRMLEVLKFLKNAKQDIQLHTHPGTAGIWGSGGLVSKPLDEQIEIIRWGKEFIEDSIGNKVMAHRAGSYKADNNTLIALKYNNIIYDASLFFKSRNCRIDTKGVMYNDICMLDGIIEVPVTTMRVNSLFFKNILLKLDIEQEEEFILNSLKLLKELNYKYVTFFMHSFSLMNNYSKDIKPNIKNIRKLHKILYAIRELNLNTVTFDTLNPSAEELVEIKDIPSIYVNVGKSINMIINRLKSEIRYQLNKTWIIEVKENYGF